MRWEIQYSYQFFSQKKHYFFIEAVMRLRHKKPLNPYKGQTNNDKNEFNDDDFNQQGSPHKKAANGSTDQIYKYARILAKFIKTINQDVKEYQPGVHTISRDSYHPMPLDLSSSSAPLPQPPISQQNRMQKQPQKLQIKNQAKEEQKEGKSIQKKKSGGTTQAVSKQPRNKLQQNQPNGENTVDRLKNSIIPKAPNPPAQDKSEKEIKPEKLQFSQIRNTPQLGFLAGNVVTTPGKYWDAMIGTKFPTDIHQYLNMSKMWAAYPQYAPPQVRFTGTIPPSLNRGVPMTFIGLPNTPFQQQELQPACNLFQQHLKITVNKNTNKAAFPLKRAAYHVTIAYKIYLDKLQKQGVAINYLALDEIDPTRHARRVKSAQGQNGKTKETRKKK